MYHPILRVHLKKISKGLSIGCFCVCAFLTFFIKAYAVGTHLNCIYDAIQMDAHNICLYKVDKKYTCCNLKTTELLDCAFIGINAVIRSNTVLREKR